MTREQREEHHRHRHGQAKDHRRGDARPAPRSPSPLTPAARFTEVQGQDRTMLARCLIFVGKSVWVLILRVPRLSCLVPRARALFDGAIKRPRG